MHISTPTPDIQFKADNLMLGFCRDTALSLVSIAGYDGAEWLVGPVTGEGLWRLAFRGPDGTSPVIRHGDAEFVGADAAGGKVLLRWRIYLNENSPTEVVVTIRPDSEQRLSLWAIEAGVPDGWQVTRCDFPVLPNLSMEPDSAAVVPAGWGVQYALQPGFDYAASYPSCLAAMQCVFVTQSHSVLYLAAHDARANLKSFSLRGGIRGAKFECSVPASPDWQCTGVFRLPYEFAVGIVHGGLFEAAAIYREFSLSTPWGCAGSVADRGIPKWLLETDLWLRPDGSPEANIAVTGEALDYFGAGTALHWYRWHKVRYDTHYPGVLPAASGFRRCGRRDAGARRAGDALHQRQAVGSGVGKLVRRRGRGRRRAPRGRVMLQRGLRVPDSEQCDVPHDSAVAAQGGGTRRAHDGRTWRQGRLH